MKKFTLSIIVALLAGCAGLEISSLSVKKAKNAHKPDNGVNGYIVYHPMIVVELAEKELCIEKSKSGKCTKVKTVCGMGKPTLFPDYSKPFLLNPRSGFGKAGIDVKIEDGWRLGSIKDNSNNTALLSALVAAGGIKTQSLNPAGESSGGCSEPGLYQLSFKKGKMKMESILKY